MRRRLHRRHDVLADALAQKLSIKQHIVDVSDGDHLGARVANLSQTLQIGEHPLPVEQRFDDDQVWGRGVAIARDGRFDGRGHARGTDGDGQAVLRDLSQ